MRAVSPARDRWCISFEGSPTTEREFPMQNLTSANRELFSRSPDEVFDSLDSLYRQCLADKEGSEDHWHAPQEIRPTPVEGRLELELGGGGTYRLNDWSFSQLCKFAGVSKETLNK